MMMTPDPAERPDIDGVLLHSEVQRILKKDSNITMPQSSIH